MGAKKIFGSHFFRVNADDDRVACERLCTFLGLARRPPIGCHAQPIWWTCDQKTGLRSLQSTEQTRTCRVPDGAITNRRNLPSSTLSKNRIGQNLYE